MILWICLLSVISTELVSHFTLLCSAHTNYSFYKVKVVATLHPASLSVPFFQHHLLTLCLWVTFWQFFQHFKPFYPYYLCYGDRWSVIFDVPTTRHWRLRWWSAVFISKEIFNMCLFGLHWVSVAVHGLSLAAVSGVYPLDTERGLLIAVASLIAAHKLQSSWVSVPVARGR